jgi:hypothetical protein
MKKQNQTAARHDLPTESPADRAHQCVADAARGDRAAIGWIAIVAGGFLFDEIVDELGPDHRQEADDAVQDFFLALCEGTLLPPGPGEGIDWLGRVARQFARANKGGAR